jgi:hypothetical protein
VGGVAALLYYSPREPDPVESPPSATGPHESKAPIQAPRKATSTSAASPAPQTSDPASASPGLTIEHRVFTAAQTGTKLGYRDVLTDWRSGRLTPEQDRAIGDLVGSVRSVELDKAAGQLLLGDETTPAQRRSLGALLAASSSEDAIGYLLAACDDPAIRPEVIEALATVSEPGALPQLIRTVNEDTPTEVLHALLRATRGMDTEKARDLEAEIRALLNNR